MLLVRGNQNQSSDLSSASLDLSSGIWFKRAIRKALIEAAGLRLEAMIFPSTFLFYILAKVPKLICFYYWSKAHAFDLSHSDFF